MGSVMADDGAQAAQDFALAVVVIRRHHRAVQHQEYAVPAALRRGLKQGCKEGFECLPRHAPAGSGGGADHMGHVPATGAAHIQKPGQFGVLVALRTDRGSAVQQVAVAERLQTGRTDAERVGLVGDLGGKNGVSHVRRTSLSDRVVARDRMAGRCRDPAFAGRHSALAWGQRSAKAQPGGRSKGLGTSPSSGAIRRRFPGSGSNVLSMSVLV
jgi:hypothetical protein